jgi:hypothetical protein
LIKITRIKQITGVNALHTLMIPDAQLDHTKETFPHLSELRR